MKARAPLGTAGRVVIPKAIRERLGLEPGDELEFEIEGNGLRITPLPSSGGCLREKGGVLVLTCTVEGDLDHRSLREARIRRLSGTGA